MAYTIRNLRLGPGMRSVLCVIVVAACSVQSFASGPLTTDPAAYDDGTGPAAGAWRGAVVIPSLIQDLRVEVNYAVYAPGTLGNSTLFDLSDVTGADTEYVYVYQIHNDIGGTNVLTSFTVGLSDLPFPDLPPPGNDGFDAELPSNNGWVSGYGVDPALSQIAPNNIDRDPLAQGITWEFNSGLGLEVNAVSTMLVYTATGGPEFDAASILGGGEGGTGYVPSPTAHAPEPSSFVLSLIASMGLVCRRKF